MRAPTANDVRKLRLKPGEHVLLVDTPAVPRPFLVVSLPMGSFFLFATYLCLSETYRCGCSADFFFTYAVFLPLQAFFTVACLIVAYLLAVQPPLAIFLGAHLGRAVTSERVRSPPQTMFPWLQGPSTHLSEFTHAVDVQIPAYWEYVRGRRRPTLVPAHHDVALMRLTETGEEIEVDRIFEVSNPAEVIEVLAHARDAWLKTHGLTSGVAPDERTRVVKPPRAVASELAPSEAVRWAARARPALSPNGFDHFAMAMVVVLGVAWAGRLVTNFVVEPFVWLVAISQLLFFASLSLVPRHLSGRFPWGPGRAYAITRTRILVVDETGKEPPQSLDLHAIAAIERKELRPDYGHLLITGPAGEGEQPPARLELRHVSPLSEVHRILQAALRDAR